jgi:hypothetical protein
MLSERDQQIAPVVQESVAHNTKVCSLCSTLIHLSQPPKHRPPARQHHMSWSNPYILPKLTLHSKSLAEIRALTASLFGVGAGILGLESYSGFIFYLVFSLITTGLIHALRVSPAAGKAGAAMFFSSAWELWLGGLVDGLSGFVLTWTLAFGLVRA